MAKGKKKTKYKRILLKLSGEAMRGKREFGIDPEFISYLASEIVSAHKLGVQIAVVTGDDVMPLLQQLREAQPPVTELQSNAPSHHPDTIDGVHESLCLGLK